MSKKKYFIVPIFLLIILTSTLILGTSSNSENNTTNNINCATCHIDIVQDWENTYHSKSNCKSCHSQGLVQDSIGGVRKIALTLFKQNDPDDYEAEVSNDSCLQCHNIHASGRNLLVIRQHDRFIETNYSCTRCHYDTGHATTNKYEIPDMEELTVESPYKSDSP